MGLLQRSGSARLSLRPRATSRVVSSPSVGVLFAMIALSFLTQGLQWISIAIYGAGTTVAWLVANVVVCVASIGLLRLTHRGRGRLAACLLASILGFLAMALAGVDGVQNPIWGVSSPSW